MKNKINFFSIFRIEKRNLYRFSDFSEKSINENIDILKNFTKINSGIERWKLIFFNAINALKDPEKYDF